jgi:hypothetical protein
MLYLDHTSDQVSYLWRTELQVLAFVLKVTRVECEGLYRPQRFATAPGTHQQRFWTAILELLRSIRMHVQSRYKHI